MGAGVELFALRKGGAEFPAEISLSSIEGEDGATLAMVAVRDISERAESEREKALQEQLNQSRRLESVAPRCRRFSRRFERDLRLRRRTPRS